MGSKDFIEQIKWEKPKAWFWPFFMPPVLSINVSLTVNGHILCFCWFTQKYWWFIVFCCLCSNSAEKCSVRISANHYFNLYIQVLHVTSFDLGGHDPCSATQEHLMIAFCKPDSPSVVSSDSFCSTPDWSLCCCYSCEKKLPHSDQANLLPMLEGRTRVQYICGTDFWAGCRGFSLGTPICSLLS